MALNIYLDKAMVKVKEALFINKNYAQAMASLSSARRYYKMLQRKVPVTSLEEKAAEIESLAEMIINKSEQNQNYWR